MFRTLALVLLISVTTLAQSPADRPLLITRVAINNPVFAAMVMVALCVLGVFSYNRLRVERMPDITVPFVFIQVQYPGAAPEAVENDINKPIEEVVNTVNGVKTSRSNAWEGRGETYIEFRLDTNMERAIQDVRDKIALVRPGFPREVKDPLVLRGDFDNAQPIVSLAVYSDTRTLRTGLSVDPAGRRTGFLRFVAISCPLVEPPSVGRL